MHYRDFFAGLKNHTLSGLYLFHGEEEYIKQSALNQLVESIDPIARDLNLQQVRSPLASEVLTAAETLPFFSEKRLIICQDVADAELKALLAAKDDLPESTILIAYVRGACKKDIVKLANGADVEFQQMTESEASRFIEKRARERNAVIGREAAALLLEMVGLEAHQLENELHKAIDYAGESASVTVEILNACVTPQPEYEYFKLLDSLLAGKRKDALTAYRHMARKDQGVAFALAHSLTGQLKNILSARLLIDSGVRENEIAPRLKLSSWAARTALRGAKRMAAEQIRGAISAIASVDYLQVSGQMNAVLALENALIRYF